MIVRCPECQTGFNLPIDKIGVRGTKVRCSKCDHVFRVKVVDGRPVVIGVSGSSQTSHEKTFEADRGKTHLVTPVSGKMTPTFERPKTGNSTTLGRAGAASKSSERLKARRSPDQSELPAMARKDSTPAPTSQRESTNPPQAQVFKSNAPVRESAIDLFEDDESNLGAPQDDPFEGVFEEEHSVVESNDEMVVTIGLAESLYNDRSTWDHTPLPKPQPDNFQGNATPMPGKRSSEEFFLRGNPAFANDDDLVDPAFGTDGRSFDPEQGVVDPGPEESGYHRDPSESQEREPSETVRAAARRDPATTAPPMVASARGTDSRPHRIGGSAGRRVFETLFIVLIIVNGFVLTVSALSGWFFDFAQPLHMLEVAFSGKSYSPAGIINLPDASAPYSTNLTSRMIHKDGKYWLVLEGIFINPTETSVSTPQYNGVLAVGEDVEIASLIFGSNFDASTYNPNLLPPSQNDLPAKTPMPFFVVFERDEAPKSFELKVE